MTRTIGFVWHSGAVWRVMRGSPVPRGVPRHRLAAPADRHRDLGVLYVPKGMAGPSDPGMTALIAAGERGLGPRVVIGDLPG